MEPSNNVPQPGQVVQPTTNQEQAPSPVLTPAQQAVELAAARAVAAAVIDQVKPIAQAEAVAAANSVLADFERTHFGQKAVKFFDSAVGKSVQTLLWTLLAFFLTVAGIKLANVHFNAELLALGVPGLLNWILYTAKVFVDGKVPNLPKPAPTQ